MVMYSGFTWIYPLKMVMFHRFFVCLPGRAGRVAQSDDDSPDSSPVSEAQSKILPPSVMSLRHPNMQKTSRGYHLPSCRLATLKNNKNTYIKMFFFVCVVFFTSEILNHQDKHRQTQVDVIYILWPPMASNLRMMCVCVNPSSTGNG